MTTSALARGLAGAVLLPTGIQTLDLVGYGDRSLHWLYAACVGLSAAPLMALYGVIRSEGRRTAFQVAAAAGLGVAAFLACLLAEFGSRFFGALLGRVQWWADIAFDPTVWDCLTYALSSASYVIVRQPEQYTFLYFPVAVALTGSTILASHRMPLVISSTIAAGAGLVCWLAAGFGLGVTNTINAAFLLRLTMVASIVLPVVDRVLVHWGRAR